MKTNILSVIENRVEELRHKRERIGPRSMDEKCVLDIRIEELERVLQLYNGKGGKRS